MIAITSADICMCWRMPICSQARTNSDLVPMRVDKGARAMWAAIFSTADSSSARGTTLLIRPCSTASWAVRVREV